MDCLSLSKFDLKQIFEDKVFDFYFWCSAPKKERDFFLNVTIQWTPLNVITDNVINRLILLEFLITARTYNIHYKYAAYCNQYIGYCYQYFPKRSD